MSDLLGAFLAGAFVGIAALVLFVWVPEYLAARRVVAKPEVKPAAQVDRVSRAARRRAWRGWTWSTVDGLIERERELERRERELADREKNLNASRRAI